MSWWKSGVNWMWATWVDDAQVVYLARNLPGRGWDVLKKVTGAADKAGHIIGETEDLEGAKALAEADAKLPL